MVFIENCVSVFFFDEVIRMRLERHPFGRCCGPFGRYRKVFCLSGRNWELNVSTIVSLLCGVDV